MGWEPPGLGWPHGLCGTPSLVLPHKLYGALGSGWPHRLCGGVGPHRLCPEMAEYSKAV